MTDKPDIRLNLGAGKTKIPGVLNVDRVLVHGYTDIVHDLNKTPYPFADASVAEIHMYHVLEHLDEPVHKMEELHRILKPGGQLFLRVPHFSSMGAFSDITHKRPFGYTSFDCFEEGSYHSFYTHARFKIEDKRIKYFGLFPNGGLYAEYIHANKCFILLRPLVRCIDFMANWSPTAFERGWCYWVGGATEIVLTLRK